MKLFNTFFIFILLIGLTDCSKPKQNQVKNSQEENSESQLLLPSKYNSYQVVMTGYDTARFNQHYTSRIDPPLINLNQSLEGKSISDLILLKNSLLAMKGELFTDAIYDSYFRSIPWYQPPFWEKGFKIEITKEEAHFIHRIEQHLAQLLQYNYLNDGLVNPENAVNKFQFAPLGQEVIDKIKTHGFVMNSGEQPHFFDVYLQNHEQVIPSFISTDLALQEMHLFYGLLENEIEEKYLIDLLKEMLEIINIELYSAYEKTLNPQIEKAIEENLLYYSIPFAVISGKKNNLIGNYNLYYVDELTKVLNAEGIGSDILDNDQLDYKIFKPYARYIKNDKTEKYFKALTWLQKIKLCLNNDQDFRKALIMGYIINKSDALKKKYSEYVELKTYFSSQPDQFTLWDLAKVISGTNAIGKFDDLFKEQNMAKIREKLWLNDQTECKLSVSLMPIEYQNLYTNLNQISNKDSNVSSIDLFAALGNPASKSLLNQTSSIANEAYLASITENLLSISIQENTRSMDWLSTLITSFNDHHHTLSFMNIDPWKRKELNAIAGSWIQLNQRVNLSVRNQKRFISNDTYSNKVNLKGFVEPNPNFWSAASILLENTQIFFSDRNKLSKNSAQNLDRFQQLMHTLYDISQKEIAGSRLDKEDYDKINAIASDFQDIIVKQLNPNYSSKFQSIATNMAYATNIFRNKNDKYTLGGIGPASTIIVPLEIDGYVYLTKGAVYNYLELTDYNKSVIYSAEWNKLLEKKTPSNKWTMNLFYEWKVEEKEMILATNF